jgi:membrane protease YdiL (CAAX protease family)
MISGLGMAQATGGQGLRGEGTRANRALVLFFLLLSVLAAAVYVPVVQQGSLAALNGLALPLLMWVPGVSGLVVSGVVYRSLRPLGLGLSWRGLLWSLAFFALPLAYTLLIYGPLSALEIVDLGSDNWRVAFFVQGITQGLLFAVGEELGWRGFAAPLLARRWGFLRGQALLGLVWFVYHLPALLLTGYGKSALPFFGNAMFFVTVVALSVVLGWSRLASKSMWPAAIYHMSHNMFFLHLFDPMERRSGSADIWIGEQGAALALVMVLLAVAATWAWRRGPMPRGAEGAPLGPP